MSVILPKLLEKSYCTPQRLKYKPIKLKCELIRSKLFSNTKANDLIDPTTEKANKFFYFLRYKKPFKMFDKSETLDINIRERSKANKLKKAEEFKKFIDIKRKFILKHHSINGTENDNLLSTLNNKESKTILTTRKIELNRRIFSLKKTQSKSEGKSVLYKRLFSKINNSVL